MFYITNFIRYTFLEINLQRSHEPIPSDNQPLILNDEALPEK